MTRTSSASSRTRNLRAAVQGRRSRLFLRARMPTELYGPRHWPAPTLLLRARVSLKETESVSSVG